MTAYEMRISDWNSYVCSSDLKFKQQLFLTQFFEENSCFHIVFVAFQLHHLSEAEALMLHFHAHLQITGIGWCESRCGRMCRGQQCPCFWRYLRLWFGKYVTFAQCRPLIGKRCAAFRNRARFEDRKRTSLDS